MTSRVKATITYNHPIIVTKEDMANTEILFKSEGTPGTYIGEQKKDIDTWFSGNQVIVIREQEKAIVRQ
jgi:hypothetical protein